MLRRKILLSITMVFAVGIGVLYLVSRVAFLSKLEEIERAEIKKDIGIITTLFENEINSLDVFVQDWASWDDTYEYVLDRNEEYIESNLVDETFTGANLNLMM